MIGLLGKPMHKGKPEGGLLEPEMEMPETNPPAPTVGPAGEKV